MTRVMRAALVLLTSLLLPMSAAAEHSASADTNGLHYYFATANDTLVFGEVMPIDWVVTNVSEDSILVYFPCSGPGNSFTYQIWAPGPPADPAPRVICGCCACFPVVGWDWFEPGEVYSRHFVRNTETFPRPGTYTLDGWFSAWTMVGGEQVPLSYGFSLDFQLWGGPTGLVEPEVTWSTIKALYR